MFRFCFVYLLLRIYILNGDGNTFCYESFTNSDNIVRFDGYMNVPIKPAIEPGKVLFLWPGINPYAGEGGLMQPVLTYGADYGQGNNKWGMANWFSDCPGYCHDPYKPVMEGDVIYFYMQYIKTYTNGSHLWEMGYNSYNYPSTRSTFYVYREGSYVSNIWATEAEFYLDPANETNYDKLPLSYYYTWNLSVITSDGKNYKLNWQTHIGNENGNRVNCSFAVNNNNALFVGTQLIYPPYNNGCSDGYSRKWNYACQTFCGCNNVDGTPKIECDYCCINDNGCKRENGPSYHSDSQSIYSNNIDTSSLPHPGFL